MATSATSVLFLDTSVVREILDLPGDGRASLLDQLKAAAGPAPIRIPIEVLHELAEQLESNPKRWALWSQGRRALAEAVDSRRPISNVLETPAVRAREEATQGAAAVDATLLVGAHGYAALWKVFCGAGSREMFDLWVVAGLRFSFEDLATAKSLCLAKAPSYDAVVEFKMASAEHGTANILGAHFGAGGLAPGDVHGRAFRMIAERDAGRAITPERHQDRNMMYDARILSYSSIPGARVASFEKRHLEIFGAERILKPQARAPSTS